METDLFLFTMAIWKFHVLNNVRNLKASPQKYLLIPVSRDLEIRCKIQSKLCLDLTPESLLFHGFKEIAILGPKIGMQFLHKLNK